MTPRNPARESIGHEVEAVMRMLGKEPLPYQHDIFDVAFEVDSFGLLWYREIVIIIPRQSGKSTVVIPWGVHRCVTWPERQFMLYIAQTRDKALEKLVDEHFYAIDASPFRRLLVPNRSGKIQPNLSHGAEHMRFVNGSKWAIDAPTEDAGHGGTLGLTIGDEIFAQRDSRLEAALMPATTAVPDSQSLWISTVGKSKTASPFLWGKAEAGRNRVEMARADPSFLNVHRTLYIEFSFAPDDDWLDPLVWWANMPALGYTTSQDKIGAFADAMGEPEFRRAFGNQWADDLATDWKIPADKWAARLDPDSQIGDKLVWFVDVSPDRAWASIAVASQRGDGKLHVEVVERWPGTEWVVDGEPTRGDDLLTCKGIAALVAEHGGEVYYDHITTGALVPDMRDAGLEPKPVAAEDAKVAGAALLDAVLNGTVRHIGQDELSNALASAATRKFGDGWAWSRGASMQDITALVAVTLAHWMLRKTLPDLNYDPLAAMREAHGREPR